MSHLQNQQKNFCDDGNQQKEESNSKLINANEQQQKKQNKKILNKNHFSDFQGVSQISKNTKKNVMDHNQLKKVEGYMKKYEPSYFTLAQVKQLSYKYKKGVEILKYKQAYYFGETTQDQETKIIKSGKGIIVYSLFGKKSNIKRIYEGEWKNDQKEGLGFEKFSNGSIYHGHYSNGKPQGKGKLTNSNGQVYEGEWQQGIKEGQGNWKGTKGQSYSGEWKFNQPQGYGIFINEKGDRYEGQFQKSVKHGQGTEKFINGDIYKGSYENDRPSGYGEYYWKNKTYFKGNFKNGLRCGRGFWKRGAGQTDKYQGNYENDKKWGYGVFTWANGNIYQGNYQGDLRNGYGQMHWKNGSYYKGHWKNGLQNQQGQLFIVDEGLRKGIFENNELVEIHFENLISPVKAIENEENQQQAQTKMSKLDSGASFTTKMSIKSKRSSLSNRKLNEVKEKTIHKIKTESQHSRISLIQLQNNKIINNKKQKEIIPLARLLDHSRQINSSFNKNDKSRIGFRFLKKNGQMQYMQSLDDSSRIWNKKKQRILHCSFYIHRFKNIGKPNFASKVISDL